MSTAKPRLTAISFTDREVVGHFADGRSVACPLHWFPILEKASPKERLQYQLRRQGASAHWPALDEDLSAEGFFTYAPQPVSA